MLGVYSAQKLAQRLNATGHMNNKCKLMIGISGWMDNNHANI